MKITDCTHSEHISNLLMKFWMPVLNLQYEDVKHSESSPDRRLFGLNGEQDPVI